MHGMSPCNNGISNASGYMDVATPWSSSCMVAVGGSACSELFLGHVAFHLARSQPAGGGERICTAAPYSCQACKVYQGFCKVPLEVRQ